MTLPAPWRGGPARSGSFWGALTPAPTPQLSPLAVPRVVAASPERASSNLRRHTLRSVVRIASCLAVDAAAVIALDQLLHRASAWPIAGRAAAGVLEAAGPAAHLAAWQVAAGLALALLVTGNYGAGDRRRDPDRLFVGSALGLALPMWGALWLQPVPMLFHFALALILLTLALGIGRFVLDVVAHHTVPARATSSRTLLVGPAADCLALFGRTAFSDECGFSLVGCVDPADLPGGAGLADAIEQTLRAQRVDTVVVCGATITESVLAQVLRAATLTECAVLRTSPLLELPGVHPELVWRHKQPFLELRAAALRGGQLVAKRILDIVAASVLLVLAAPIMLLTAIAIRLDSRGPLVFGQPRLGRHGHIFRCFKFRSMHPDAERLLRADPALHAEYVRNDFKLPPERDPRITRVGRRLRAWSIDELPQLWNVLRGDMSLVGPRPIVVDELQHYGTEQPLFLSLRPGVTGAWQVKGRSRVAYPDRAQVELEYVRSWSIGRDVRLLLQTVPAVLARRGAY